MRRDKKTANVISTAVFHEDGKVIAMTLNFFLSPDGKDDDSDEDTVCILLFLKNHSPVKPSQPRTEREIKRKYGFRHSKKTRKKTKQLKEKLSEAKKVRIVFLRIPIFY